jgi:hypothetical protein
VRSTQELRKALLDVLSEVNLEVVFKDDVQRNFLFGRLDQLGTAYAGRMRGVPTGLLPATASLEDILAEHERNPHRVQTLLEAAAFQCSPEILSMVWMTLLGSRIENVSYEYFRERSSTLKVTLMLPDWQTKIDFTSSEHWDAAVLRFATLSKAGELPMIEDFQALWIPPQGVWDHDLHVETDQGSFGAIDTAPAASPTPRWEVHQVYAKLPSRQIGTIDVHVQGAPGSSPLPENGPILAMAWRALVRKYGDEVLAQRPRRRVPDED